MRPFLIRPAAALACLGLVLLSACGTSATVDPTPATTPVAAATTAEPSPTAVVVPTAPPTTVAPSAPTPTLVPTTAPVQTAPVASTAEPVAPTVAAALEVETYTHPTGAWSVQYAPALLQVGDLGDGVTIFVSSDRSTFAAVDTYAASGDEVGNTGEGLRNRARDTLGRIYGKPVAETGVIAAQAQPWETGITFATDGGSKGEAVYEQRGRTAGNFQVSGFLYGYQAANESVILPLLQAMRASFVATVPATAATAVAGSSSFLYVHQGILWEQAGAGAPRQVTPLPQGSSVLAARLVGDTLLLLREQGVERIGLSDVSSDVVRSFDFRARFGSLDATPDGKRVIYAASVEDPRSSFGAAARLGVYDVETGASRAVTPTAELAAYPGLAPLGLTPDGANMYLLPRGQDPAFARVAVVAVETGQLVRDLPISGEGGVSLSSDGTVAVATGPCRPTSEAGLLINVLQFYDLRQNPLQPREIPLPPAPCPLSGLAWAPDNSALYAVTTGDPSTAPGRPATVLRIDARTGAVTPVATLDQAEHHLLALSPDGRWLLLRRATEPRATLLTLPNGEPAEIDLPVEAVFAGWR